MPCDPPSTLLRHPSRLFRSAKQAAAPACATRPSPTADVNPYAPPTPQAASPRAAERRMRWIVVGCGCGGLVGLFVLFVSFLAIWQYLAPTERVVPPKRGVSPPM